MSARAGSFSRLGGLEISTRVRALRCLVHHAGEARLQDLVREGNLDYTTLHRQLPRLAGEGVLHPYEEDGQLHLRLVVAPLGPLQAANQELWTLLWKEWRGTNMRQAVHPRSLLRALNWDSRTLARHLRELERAGWLELRLLGHCTLMSAPSLPALVHELRQSEEWGLLHACLRKAEELLAQARQALEEADTVTVLARLAQAHAALAHLVHAPPDAETA